jgi:hypothetical protein
MYRRGVVDLTVQLVVYHIIFRSKRSCRRLYKSLENHSTNTQRLVPPSASSSADFETSHKATTPPINITMSVYAAFVISKLQHMHGFIPSSGQVDQQASTPLQPTNSRFEFKCHRLVDEASKEVNDCFLERWAFPDARSRKRFVAASFPNVTCMYFPLSRDDKIEYGCRLITLLFLIDGMHLRIHPFRPILTTIYKDELEHMSFEDGET